MKKSNAELPSTELDDYSAALEILRITQLYFDRKGRESYPVLCKLHDAFGTYDSIDHNCLGCNFADLTNSFGAVLKTLHAVKEVNGAFITYILWLHLFAQRYSEILNFIGVPEPIRQKRFPSLYLIKCWANFVKHPKSFLFCHHPDCFVGPTSGPLEEPKVLIDDAFVKRHYSGTDHDKELAKLLRNQTSVAVQYPSPVMLMEAFARDTHTFLALLEDNEVYREQLASATTAANFHG